MKTSWTTEHLTRKPETFEQLNATTYIQRRNIRVDDTQKDETMARTETEYICESRMISKDVYEAYEDDLYSMSQQQTDDTLSDITVTQSESSSNQMTTMEAIAEIYAKLDELSAKLDSSTT